MMRRSSVSRRLIRGLGQVGLVGTLLLLAAVVFFYRLTFSHLEAGAACNALYWSRWNMSRFRWSCSWFRSPSLVFGSSGRPLSRWRKRPEHRGRQGA
jgi:hypothetical protein